MRRTVYCIALTLAMLLACHAGTPCFAQRSLLSTIYNSGVKAYEKGDYREALRIFRQCEVMAKTTKHNPAEEAALLYSLAEALRASGQLQQAEPVFKEAVTVTDSLPVRQRSYVYLFNSMALLYQSQGRFTEAEGLWKQSEDSAPKGSAMRAFPIGNLARHYYIWGKLPEEVQYVEKCREMAKRYPTTLALPYWQYNLAQLNEQKGLYKEAEAQYNLAIASCTKIYGALHPYCGVTLTGLADLYRKQSRYQDAESTLQRVLKIYEGQYSSEHPDIAETKVHLSRVLSDQGKYVQARELVQDALKTEEAAFGSTDNLFVARAKDCLGNIYRQYGRYQEAQQMLDQALEMKRHVLGADNVEVATTMRHLAMVQEDQANYPQAEALLKSSLSIIEKQTGSEHPERAEAINALAHAYLRDERFADAEPLLKKALELSENALGLDNVVTANGARDLGTLYMKQKQYAEAQSYLQKALTIDEKLYGDKAPQIAADLISLATAYGLQSQSDKAAPLLKRAAEIKNVLAGGNAVPDETPTLTTNTTSDRPITDKWALVIGISNFKDSSINLKYAAKDATDFKNFLINTQKFRPDHVKLLTDESATRDNIIGMMGEKWLGSHVKDDDLVVVYVSSHGSSATAEAGGANFLVAYDTNKNSLLATGIPMQWLTKIVSDQVHSNRVVLLLDVCHSGAAGEGRKSLTRTAGIDPRVLKMGDGQMIICSSQADQVSWESRNYENSVFTRRLMEALLSNKDQTTIFNAYKQLKILVESEVLRDRGELQTPLLVNKNWLGKDPTLSTDTSNK